MQTLVERGCGLAVHQATVVACLLIALRNGQVQKQVAGMVALGRWHPGSHGEHRGVLEAGLRALLEGALEIVVANAQHVGKVPGRKTDVKDAEWISDLLCHGLLRPSFVAPPPIRELRDLTRYRRRRVRRRSAIVC
jgi:transposase